MFPDTSRFANSIQLLRSLLTLTLLTFSHTLLAQNVESDTLSLEQSLIQEWIFWPNNTLGQRAANYPGPKIEQPQTPIQALTMQSHPLVFFGELPTERKVNVLEPDQFQQQTFSVELWFLDHVDQPVGALTTVKGRTVNDRPAWVLGYHDQKVFVSMNTASTPEPFELERELERGWKQYWHHLVCTYDGQALKIYWNGTLLEENAVPGPILFPNPPEFEIAAYTSSEPYMDTADLLKVARLYNEVLTETTIRDRFERLKEQVEAGVLFVDLFHFNAGPYLNYATEHSINILWETNQAATATIKYGRSTPLTDSLIVDRPSNIQEITLDGLDLETPYFYEITARSPYGESISSGLLTFQTAVRDGTPFSFAVIGDTEARPHINDRLAKLVWNERPNFMLNVGDLTDGGMEADKFQWNYEYFVGMTQLNSRVPVFPVPGNGEADLYWYNRYHVLPQPEAYYTFRYGNAEFFMLDSNQKRDAFAPDGEQYRWLEERLKASTATWKFVAHHHPTYTMEEDDYGDSWTEETALGDLYVRQILPLYEAYGVDMVIFGHLHSYERSVPVKGGMMDVQNGVVHLLAGGGGGNVEDFAPTRSWFTTKTHRGHHFGMVDLHDMKLTLTMYDLDGRMRDRMEIHKDRTPSPNEVGITPGGGTLTGPIQVSLSAQAQDVTIRYTLDGTMPTADSPAYEGPVDLEEPALLTAASFEDGVRVSVASRARFDQPQAPEIEPQSGLFVEETEVTLSSRTPGAEICYTTDGSVPTPASNLYTQPIRITATTTLTAQAFWPSGMQSEAMQRTYTLTEYRDPDAPGNTRAGLAYDYYQGVWGRLPDFATLTPIHSDITLELSPRKLRQRDDYFGIVYRGYLEVPRDGVYRFYLKSDDGSRFLIGDQTVVENYSQNESSGEIALRAGKHRIELQYYNEEGREGLYIGYRGPGLPKQGIPFQDFSH